MTECERIIEQGILPASFFQPETRCDFYVSEERKKVWAVQIDLFLKLESVCRKHGLRCFLAAGSLLGAIRHKGFIPWDDDIDVNMTREDFTVLLSLSDEFEHPYFLQTPYTDPRAYFSNARLRNSNTTGVNDLFLYQGFNGGINIDINPLDKWDKQDTLGIARIKELNIENGTYMRMTHPHLSEKNKERVKGWGGTDPLSAYEEIQRIAQRYNHSSTINQVMEAIATVYTMDRLLLNIEDVSETIPWEFEGLRFPVPIGYQNILTTMYGNYMELPPVSQRGIWHGEVHFDADTPYSEYIKRHCCGD